MDIIPACRRVLSVVARLAALAACALGLRAAPADEPKPPAPSAPPARFPTIPPGHTHVRALLEDAMRYVDPANKMVDPVSGYPFEGWNHDPKNGVYLRSFTQLTAIGQYMELLANVAAGAAATPALPRELALEQLAHLVASLRHDQADPKLGARGLLVNFLDLATGKRLGPLASDVEKRTVLDAFGPDRGEAIWKALQAKGWIVPRTDGREAEIKRADKYGYEFIDASLAPPGDLATRRKVMEILDGRVVMIVFVDNANLSASAARTIGALLHPDLADLPAVVAIRRDLARFLDDQRDGYAHLYDPKAGLFYFGWDATRDRLFGWDDLQGNWTTGHVDYFVNEFRGPATFIAARYDIPAASIANLGFKMKPYRTRRGDLLYVLAPWEGSAFQALGLALFLGEPDRPGWRTLLGHVVEVEADYSARHGLPGFLSESYTGEGTRYTGSVGIPEITVSPRPRVTDAASLYCLGVAYAIHPEKVEAFLAANWPVVSTLLSDHGPWEGYNVTTRQVIRFQTSAHTLSLILGLLGTGSAHMRRYADHAGFGPRLESFFPAGDGADMLSQDMNVFSWSDKASRIDTTRERESFRVRSDRVALLGVAFVPKRTEGVDVSGRVLALRYRSSHAMDPVIIALKPTPGAPVPGLIPNEIFARLADTGGRDDELRIPLPATVGLSRIKEVVLTHEPGGSGRPIDLTVTGLEFLPAAPGPASR